MGPLDILLIVLAVAGIWAVAELALTLRRARGTVQSLDQTVEGVNDVIAEARPVISKLDGMVDDVQPLIKHVDEAVCDLKPLMVKVDSSLEELQPALAQVEPLLAQGSIAVEALSADLLEVNAVLRDVGDVTSNMSTASDAVSGLANAASEKVHRLFNRGQRAQDATGERTLTEPDAAAGDAQGAASDPAAVDVAVPDESAAPAADSQPERAERRAAGASYYTYADDADSAARPATTEDTDE